MHTVYLMHWLDKTSTFHQLIMPIFQPIIHLYFRKSKILVHRYCIRIPWFMWKWSAFPGSARWTIIINLLKNQFVWIKFFYFTLIYQPSTFCFDERLLLQLPPLHLLVTFQVLNSTIRVSRVAFCRHIIDLNGSSTLCYDWSLYVFERTVSGKAIMVIDVAQ